MDNQDYLYQLRHTAAHVLAAVLKKMYPGLTLAIGPAIEHGFYYDVDSPIPITDKDLPKIEKEMKALIKAGAEMKRADVSEEEARAHFEDAPYKLELIDEFTKENKSLTEYILGDFIDLCKGGHLDNANEIPLDGLKLTHVAGAYWRGDENNKMLTRVYGLAFKNKQQLKAHLTMLEEAKKRDHRKIGQELDLWTFSDLVGAGLPLFTAKGAILRLELEKLVRELQEPQGYKLVWSPHITKPALYQASGHWDKFADDIFHVRGKHDAEFVLKPMNCPHHTQIFASRMRSYKDLPIRMAEFGVVYRDENAGQLQGLSRVRSITQDDAHVFCRLDQVKDEVLKMFNMAEDVYKLYGIELKPMLSLRDPNAKQNYLGTDENWDKAEEELRKCLKARGIEEFETDIGGAAFYGPKIDLFGVDAIGRKWQLATFQIDFNQPEGTDLKYIDENNAEVHPVMLHRALLGAVERHLSVVIEHLGGNFPLWLSPVQVAVVPVSEKHNDAANAFAAKLNDAGIRVEVDVNDETVGKKIRHAAKQKVPYVIVYGDKEAESGVVPIRIRGKEQQIEMPVDDFIKACAANIRERKLEL